jgi:predicted DNA-binding transcriptional regulator AlpA
MRYDRFGPNSTDQEASMSFEEEDGDRNVSRAEALYLSNFKSPSTLYERIRGGDFPAPYEISPGRKAWSYAEIQSWIKRKKEARNATPSRTVAR